MQTDWRQRAATHFECQKQPASGSRGMVVTNHPLASAAGAALLAEGGNAVDAAVGSLFALTVVEPMMVGLVGGGMMHLRLADGRHTVIDGLSTAPAAARPDMYRPVPDAPANSMEVDGRENMVGAKAVAVPGNLAAWCSALERYGRLSLPDVMESAIRYADRGFISTPYLTNCIEEAAADIADDPPLAGLFLPDGVPLEAGKRLVHGAYAETLRVVAKQGVQALHGGTVGDELAADIASRGGLLSSRDLADYTLVDRETLRGSYRGFDIVGPPPPASGGVHIIQMFNILEGFDVTGAGFGSAENLHLIAELLKIAFADRNAGTADPAFVKVPVERLLSESYAEERKQSIDLGIARSWSAGVTAELSAHTTHVTVADADGMVVSATHTINSLFGARFLVPELGLIPNNYMSNFDPVPGRALSIAPGKRLTTSAAPMMAVRDGRVAYALGLPGGLRIFGSAFQALVNLIDHHMPLQAAVEAPRLWTQGGDVEVEKTIPEPVRAALRARGHRLNVVPHVAGGMTAIAIAPDGTMTGAACWRADGTAVGIGGGLARPGTRFWPNQVRR